MDTNQMITTDYHYVDQNKKIITVKCRDPNCPYNGENSPIMRSNASIVLWCEITKRYYTKDERNSGNNGLCPHGVEHKIITESFNSQ